jgi:hypothetical protein
MCVCVQAGPVGEKKSLTPHLFAHTHSTRPLLMCRRDRSEERDERTAEQREIDELTKDQRTVFVSQLVMKAGACLACVCIDVWMCMLFD